uniref:Uncharacterized protein LOC104233642 n=1 Tax=Nicotiana sylvestris TaxID=4096 RepID=A0A1U7X3D9_NICSY|nr:PREDICTED: uncharacterized protein LOC104233642 [Nicotiana sylvestris]
MAQTPTDRSNSKESKSNVQVPWNPWPLNRRLQTVKGGGISANIIRSRVVEQLGLQDQIVPAARVLNGFNMASETTKGEIMLPVNVAGTIQETKFHVIEGDMRHNALLGRPWIHNTRVVPSTLHQVLKFLTPEGIKTVYGEQPAAK